MNKLLLLLAFIALPLISYPQLKEFGLGFGNTTYVGDVSSSFVPNTFSPYISAFYRRDSRDYTHVLRLQFSYQRINGRSDNNISIVDGENLTFNNSAIELAVIEEYNFLNFGQRLRNSSKRVFFSPYVFAGLGLQYTDSHNSSYQSTSQPGLTPVIPVGAGIKFMVNPFWVIGSEIAVRKTFTDKMDGLETDKLNSSSTGTDFYYTFGFTVSHIFRKIKCPKHYGPKEYSDKPERAESY